ncbi:MAG: acyltransferase [Rhizobiales bacterium]|nr:acyltransferase [Hyphomicrobiales bacterium]
MRGIAALAVVLFHTSLLTGNMIVPGGYLAVDLFFIMSGCVIAHAYEKRLAETMSVREFAARRLIRFLPFYLIGLVCGVVVVMLSMSANTTAAPPIADIVVVLIFSLMFLPALQLPASSVMFPFNVPAWTLFYELVVNLLYAVFRRFLSDRVLAIVAAGALAVTAWGASRHGDMNFGYTLAEAPEAFARTVFSFALGVLIFRHNRNWRIHMLPVMVITAAAFLVPVPTLWRWPFDLAVVALMFPGVTALLLAAPSNNLTGLFTLLGDMSYGIYAIHYPVIGLIGWFAQDVAIDRMVLATGTVVLLIPISIFIERRIDRPLRSRLMKGLPAFIAR